MFLYTYVRKEAVHQFLNKNGLIGRALVLFYLCINKVFRMPVLYLRLYLKTHRTDYYRLLKEVHDYGAWDV